MRIIMLIGFFFIVTAAMGCDAFRGRGRIIVHESDGDWVKVYQPGKAVTPATVRRGPSREWIITTGSQQATTPALIAAEQTWIAWIIGPLLMAAGIAALALKRYLPMLPTTVGTYAITAGAAVMALAIGLPTLPTWLWILAAIALGAWLILPGLFSNLKSAKAQGATS